MLRNWRNRLAIAVPLAVGYAALLATLTHWPPDAGLPSISHPYDKLVHATAYSVLSFLLFFVLGGLLRLRLGWYFAAAIVVAVLAAIDEKTQPYFGRSCDRLDWMADMVGFALAAIFHGVLSRFVFRSQSPASPESEESA